MLFLFSFFRSYPVPSITMLLSLLLAGVVEGFGLVTMLPLLSIIVGNFRGGENVSGIADNRAGQVVVKVLSLVGLQPTVSTLLAVIVLAILLKSVLVLLAKKKVGYTVAMASTDLRLKLIDALLAARWGYFVGQPVGSFANAVATEAMRASNAYLAGSTMLAKLLQASVYIAVSLIVSWKATTVSLLAGLLFLVLFTRLIRKARKAGGKQTLLLKKLLSQLTDSMQSIKPLKAMAREHLAKAIMVEETNRLNRALRKQVFSKEALKAFQEPMITIILVVGLYFSLGHFKIPMAEIMILIFLLARILFQLGRVQQQYQKMVIFESAYWSLMDKIKEAEKEREPVQKGVVPDLKRGIRLENVFFSYQEKPIFKNLNIEFPCRSFTALVGTSGVGKTTIADLITGLYRPQHGEVYIDDIPMSKIDLRQWRNMIGYVPQDPLLVHDSVYANITFGDDAFSEHDVEEALKAAGAWDFVSSMPQGMHSSVGERGGRLSGGQRQRLAIARALVHKPKLLILDEATSALDPESEAAICRTLQELRHKLIVLAISHQPAMVEVADRTYRILPDGDVVLVADASQPAMDGRRE